MVGAPFPSRGPRERTKEHGAHGKDGDGPQRPPDDGGHAHPPGGRGRRGADPGLRVPGSSSLSDTATTRTSPSRRSTSSPSTRRRRSAASRSASTGAGSPGRVEEREKAFETYDEALAEGHGAYLLDEERADVFTASVGNLPPGQGGGPPDHHGVGAAPRRRRHPLHRCPPRSPRATPRRRTARGWGRREAERVSPPYALQVPYGLTLEVDVETSAPVRSVESPYAPDRRRRSRTAGPR